MPKLTRWAVACVAACSITINAKAELVGRHLMSLGDGRLGLEFALSDLPKGIYEQGVSRCQRMGMRMVIISGTTARTFPQMFGYAAGCWYADSGRIFVEAVVTETRQPFRRDLPVSVFQTTGAFKGWEAYKRYPPMN